MKVITHFYILDFSMKRGFILKKNRDLYKYMIGGTLIIFIGFMSLIGFFAPEKSFSEMENRRLEEQPEFSMKKLFGGNYTSSYEKYVSDQFPFRNFFIGVKSDCERISGKVENNEVYLGKDGYLFEKFKTPQREEFEKKIDAINSFAISNPNVGKYFILVPNSVKILEDKLPKFAPIDDELELIERVQKSLDKNIDFVDVYDTLLSKNHEYIYYKTDHHWTTKGAFYAYEKFCEDVGITPHNEGYFDINEATCEFYGSLYSKSGFRRLSPDSIQLYIPKTKKELEVEYFDEEKIEDTLYDFSGLNKKDKYTIFLGGNHPLIKISSNVNEKKLLIVKDSYANSLIPFLTDHFGQIYVVDLRYFDEDLSSLIEEENIGDVLILFNVKTFFEDDSIRKISW